MKTQLCISNTRAVNVETGFRGTNSENDGAEIATARATHAKGATGGGYDLCIQT